VVPYVRGRLQHRPAAQIIREVKVAAASGITSITLLGQNVNSYRVVSHQSSVIRDIGFVDLLRRASAVSGLKSVSFITCHPKDTTPELFELMAERTNIRRYLHMPIQSGSDRILKAMNRGYTAQKYLSLVDQYRRLVYNAQLSTDVIVGFPGETEDDFAATRRLMERIGFDTAYIFKYSPRPHTRAAELEDDVPMAVKKRRHAELLDLQKTISKEKKDAHAQNTSC
jgi:tRNA-2-methylthio-N6-dimethylallyladenosine synthase